MWLAHLVFYSVSANTDFGDETFHRRGEMILKSRELEGLRASGLGFWELYLGRSQRRGRREAAVEGRQSFREGDPKDRSVSLQDLDSSSSR